ncbi:MAG: phosphopantetheine-binding [Nonomuraea muscovyensis]|nr:phosphopantetheine-binding [Nonomuraea muscovyensis]
MSEASYAQHGMWITERMGAGSAYHMPVLIRFRTPPDVGALAEACRRVVGRHRLLAAALAERDGAPHLVPARETAALRVAQGGAGGRAGDGAGDTVAEEIARPFDLGRGPLIRFTLVGDTLVVVAHHVVFDGRSKDLLVDDLATLYRGGVPAPLEPLGHAEAERERVAGLLPAARAFWAARWREPRGTAVPGGTLRSRRAGPGRVLEFALDVPGVAGLTRFEVLLAAMHALLGAYGNADVGTALDLSTRTDREARHIGPFVNELPVFSRPAPGLPFASFAGGLRAELRELYAHREVPIARAVPGVKPHAALAPVSVSYRRTDATDEPGPWSVDRLAFNHAVRGALQLQLLDGPAGLTASLRYDPEEPADPGRFAGDLQAVLAAIARDPSAPLGDLLPGHAHALRETAAPARSAAPAVAPAAMPAAMPAVAPPPAAPSPPVPADAPAGDDPLAGEIRAIWEEVLQLSPIELHDDIFDLGGHSLTITQIIARMRKRLGVEVELDDFFDNPTIAGVLTVMKEGRP